MLSHRLSDASYLQSVTLSAPAQRQKILAIKADPKNCDGSRLDRYHLSTLCTTNTHQATMTMNIFSDTDFCLACEKPLKRSGQSYCDDACRAKDGASKHFNGAQVSPSILASLPALLASHITLPRQRDHDHSGASASTSSTSRSEESSPLQSPSPFAHPEQTLDDNSPKEDAFMLPGPAYPTANGIFGSQKTYTGTPPVKISAPKTQGFLPPNSSLKNEIGTPMQQQVDSTLHYGRRPGQTNSVTSPLALFPVNAHGSLRRESHGASARPALHGLSPLTKPIRLVSDPMIDVKRGPTTAATPSPLQEPVKRPISYGMHSPLILAANAQQSPASTSVDFSHANGTPGKRVGSGTGASSPRKASQGGSPKRVDGKDPQVEIDDPLIARRRSFPVQLVGSLRSQLKQPVAKASPNASTPEEDESALMSSTELQVPSANTAAAIDDRGRGRSRDRRSSPAIPEEPSAEGSDEIIESRRHLGIGSTDRSRTGRSPSRPRRAGSSDDERPSGGRRTSRAGKRDSRSRDREGERGRHGYGSEAGSPGKTTPNQHHLQTRPYQGHDLSTIAGSLLEEDASPRSQNGRTGVSPRRPESEMARLTARGAGIV
ncbi:hypothetical protein NliqN6_1713 [Naganishia liquefaciens]|uniref:Uncharacterized protein n=1 Tax=Naganishia liquefaciens TaxID=104408 RepID=A0A8H3TQW9_9TREE|nr:hypothetical protein NliqN6_1713 [Naganishia liquefaciens]